ncbi:MAG TPA: gluconokinase [Solirubrobacter sp.]|nr:gluconokinase [Solirubrobacter sp.]
MSAPAQVVVGLDVGTTGVKAAAFAPGAAWRTVAIREYPLLQPAPDRQVQDPAAILEASGEALAECVAAAGGAEVLAISVSAGMHGLMALDADLRPLTPLITWADARARGEARELRRSAEGAALHARTGVPVHPMSPLTKLMWFGRHDPQTLRGARWWVGLKELVLAWLTGAPAGELSSASGTGLIDMATRAWSPEAIALAGVSEHQLPEILSTTAALSLARATAARVGLPEGTPVVTGAADGPLGNLGTGALAPGVAGLSLGTSGALRMAVDEPRVDAGGCLFCYALTDAIWVAGGAISNGGGVLRWAGRSLAPDVEAAGGDAAVLELAASVPAGSDGLVMLPYLVAERAPLWDPSLPGAVLGLRREHTRAHLVRAALEGVCLQLRAILDSLAGIAPVTAVRATGGGLRSRLWGEMLAAVLDRPLSVVGDAEGTALGAAALGLVGIGRAASPAEAMAELADPSAPAPAPVVCAPELVATYERLRASIPELLGALEPVASLARRAEPNQAT